MIFPNAGTFNVPVQQQSAARRTRAYGPGLEGGRVKDEGIFHVQTPADATITFETLSITVRNPSGEEVPCSVTANDSGLFDAVYVPTVPGMHTVDITVENEGIPGSKFQVSCRAQGVFSSFSIVIILLAARSLLNK